MEADRLKKLMERKELLDARISKLSAAKHAKERRDDTRRKIIAGAILLEAVQRDRCAERATGIARWWDAQLAKLTRPGDRRLFDVGNDGQPNAERSEATSPTGD